MHNSDIHRIPGEFERKYIQLRQWEGRLHTDDEVIQLPETQPNHPHHREWQMRKQSTARLTGYLQRKNRSLKILEVGCGNGWLSACLARIPGSEVLGIDINQAELTQANRVFGREPFLEFSHTTLEELESAGERYDTIVFAASIQYFPDLDGCLNATKELLHAGGEIHIIDSHFYSVADVAAAKQRTAAYYEAAGFPELASYYFHHTLEELQGFQHHVLYDPNGLFNRFLKSRNPFHWIRILKE